MLSLARRTLPPLIALAAVAAAPDGGRPAEEVTSDDALPVRVVLSEPKPGAVVSNRTDMAPLAGMAIAGERPTKFELMFVIDVSGSTAWPSLIDIDGDGVVGETRSALIGGLPDTKNTDPEDSILAAEISAARKLLESLDPARARVGAVTFAGEIDPATGRRRSPQQVDARLEHPLTEDYAALARALEAVQLRGPSGGTNMEAGVKLALRELAGLSGAASDTRPGTKKVILLLTDGKPSLPFGRGNQEDPEDIEATVSAARLAKAAGVLLNVFGLGMGAIDYPVAATEMARVTGGLYTPVRRPGDVVTLLSGVSFANIEDVVAVNLTLREMADPDDMLLSPDGSFQGFVPVRPGRNRIRVSALASDGSRGSTELDIIFRHQDLTDAELERELERIRQRTRELELLREREIQERFRRNEQKRLEIEVDREPEEAPQEAPQ